MSDSSLNLQTQNVLSLIKRHKRKLLFWPALCLFLGGVFYLFCPRTYLSEARLFLRIGRESVGIDPAATTGQTMPLYTADRKDEVKSAQELFRSRSVAAAVVDQLSPEVVLGESSEDGGGNWVASVVTAPIGWAMGIVKSLDPVSKREEAIIAVENNLSVGGEPQATVIILTYTAKSPQLAQTVCQAIVDIGQSEYMRVHRSEESKPFFTEQQNRLRDQLDLSLENLRNAKNEMGLANIEQRRTTLENQYSAVELDRLSTNQQLATAEARIKALEEQVERVPERQIGSSKSVPNQGADILRGRLYELQVKSMDLESRYHDTHPLVIAVHEQLEEAKKVMAEQAEQRSETTDEINPIHQSLSLALKNEQGTVAGLKSRLVELDAQKSTILAELRAVNQHDLKIDQLTREAELARSKYMQYALTMEEARIDSELQNEQIGNMSEAQAATLAEKPVNPSKKLTAAGTISLAIAGMFALVVLSETQHPTPRPDNGEVTSALRAPRRRHRRRPLEAKTNGHSASDEPLSLPK